MPKITSYHEGGQASLWTKAKLFWFRKKNKIKHKGKLKKILVFLIGASAVFLIGVVGAFAYFVKDLPSADTLNKRKVVESTKIYDRTGTVLLYDVHGEEKRTVIPFEEIPQQLKDATLVIEDNNFYHHFGLDFKGIARSVIYNIVGKDVLGKRVSVGGSTITQQIVKNTILTSEKTYARKIKEAILAIEMEIKYSKNEILNFYLNQVAYGSNAYGVEAAAQTFFNKSAKDLTLAESALLASLTQAPSYYSPYGSHLDTLKARQEYALGRMYDFGYITKEQLEQAKKEELKFSSVKNRFGAPHFVMYVKEYLEEKYGKDYIEQAGLKVYTTLDWDLQQIAEKVVSEGVAKNIKSHNANNAALVSIDPKTGQVLTMVGSKDYWAEESSPRGCVPGKNCLFEPNVNVAIRSRQPGSSFKPYAYATAFKKGFTPDTVLFDLPTEFSTDTAECPLININYSDENPLCYHPRNYDGKFRGPLTMRQAIAQSLNLPSVKVLYLAGVNETLNTAQDMGIETLKDRSRYGLSLVLGGGEVKLLEHAAAFSVFANEGVKNPLNVILKIEESKGKILEEYKEKQIKVLEPQIARTISSVLSDEENRTPIFGSKSKLYIEGIPVAAKTGTTQEYRDGWTMGYTPSLTVGVWAGNNDNTPMKYGSDGVYVAAPMWNEFIKRAYAKKQEARPAAGQTKNNGQKKENYFDLPEQPESFNPPESITADKDVLNGSFAAATKIKIDKASGKLATEMTPPNMVEERSYFQVHSVLYFLDKDDPLGEGNGRNDPQFNNWEQPILEWLRSPERIGLYNQPLPQEYDNVHTSENQPTVYVYSPYDNQLIDGDLLKIEAEASARPGVEKVEFFLDDDLIGVKYSRPYSLNFELPPDTEEGEHVVEVRVFDVLGNFNFKKIKVDLFRFNN
jgi:1A family penicillin-binding protein